MQGPAPAPCGTSADCRSSGIGVVWWRKSGVGLD
jgi:hypothetical protein